MYEIIILPEATADLKSLRPFDRKRIAEEIRKQLVHQATIPSQNRKRLRPNRLAGWELRVESYRVFYDIEEAEDRALIVAVGFKRGSDLYVHGERFEL